MLLPPPVSVPPSSSAPLRRQVGWDRSDCWFAHCVMLDGEEQQLFAERGLGVAHCPSSNCRLASGAAGGGLGLGVRVGGWGGVCSSVRGAMMGPAMLCPARARGGGASCVPWNQLVSREHGACAPLRYTLKLSLARPKLPAPQGSARCASCGTPA